MRNSVKNNLDIPTARDRFVRDPHHVPWPSNAPNRRVRLQARRGAVASEVMPEHAALIADAAAWRGRREDGSVDPGLTTQDATRRFVVDVQRRL